MKEKKQKVGRPKLPKSEVKQVLAVRLTDGEGRDYEQRAERDGMRLSDWIRRALDPAQGRKHSDPMTACSVAS